MSGQRAVFEPEGSTTDEAVRRMMAEFQEMPDLCVTAEQATRLWRFDLVRTRNALELMAKRGYLRTARGMFWRAS